jgi:hypothetical protein
MPLGGQTSLREDGKSRNSDASCFSEGWNLISCSWSRSRSASMILSFDAVEVVKRRSCLLAQAQAVGTATTVVDGYRRLDGEAAALVRSRLG